MKNGPKKFSQGDFIGDNNENILLILPWGMEKGNVLKNEFFFFNGDLKMSSQTIFIPF